MATLAEKRRKTKFVLQPISKPLWNTETSGKKMMEKMGWSAGKGLGANEQGISEPVRAVFKQDTKGVGFKGDGNPFHNQDEFNAILANLAKTKQVEVEHEDYVEFESLEEKSKNSKARVHYKKFTRGKDLSKYSTIDLACIVGNGKKKDEPVEEVEINEDLAKHGDTENAFGVTTVHGGSIADYFKKKWNNGANKIEMASSRGLGAGSQNNEYEGTADKVCDAVEIEEYFDGPVTESYKMKKSRKEKEKSQEDAQTGCSNNLTTEKHRNIGENEIQQSEIESLQNVLENHKVKRKKKKKKKRDDNELINDINKESAGIQGQKHSDTIDVEESGVKLRKKKRKKDCVTGPSDRKLAMETSINVRQKEIRSTNANESQHVIQSEGISEKRTKKKNDHSFDSSEDFTAGDSAEDGSVLNSYERKESEKKRKGKEIILVDQEYSPSADNASSELRASGIKKSKKKICDLSVDETIVLSPLRKDKKRKLKELADQVQNDPEDSYELNGKLSECGIKMKRKKTKRNVTEPEHSLPQSDEIYSRESPVDARSLENAVAINEDAVSDCNDEKNGNEDEARKKLRRLARKFPGSSLKELPGYGVKS